MRSRLIALLILLPMIAPVQAHTLSVSHLDINTSAGKGNVRVELDLAIRDIALTLPMDANRDEVVTWGELQAMREPLNQWVLPNLSLSVAGGPCRLQPLGLATRRYIDGAYATLLFDAQCPSLEAMKVQYGLLFDMDPQHRAIVTMRNRASVDTAILRAGARSARFGPESNSPFVDFLREGIRHLLIGYDHLAFLLSLLLPSGLQRMNGAWRIGADPKSSVLRVLGIVTAFTAAHSITLTFAALGWVVPAPRWVEVAIAASVLAAALNNLRPVVTRHVWMVGFGFGLVHGFGFAGALGQLGLPNGARLQALFGFNLGVEIGQLAVVAAILPILFAIRGKPVYLKIVMPLISLVIAGFAAWWLYLRLRG